MWELDHKGGWAPKNWCFQTVVLVKALESPLESKEIKPAHPKGNQPWIFIGRIDAEAEAPLLWPPDGKSHLFRKDLDVGNDWGQEEKSATEDEMVGWHPELNGHEFKQTQGDSEGQRSLACWVYGVIKGWTRFSDWTTILQSPCFLAQGKEETNKCFSTSVEKQCFLWAIRLASGS